MFRPLFDPDLPPGFSYERDFITAAEESSLLTALDRVTFSEFELRGVVAKRRIASFGESYGGTVSEALPQFLEPLRVRIAAWADVPAAAFAMVLIDEAPAGSPIGWHRDKPRYELVAGVSLLSACRMTFRPYRPDDGAGPRRATHEITLDARSAYLMTGPSRHEFEHHIPPVHALRYSITFRTLR